MKIIDRLTLLLKMDFSGLLYLRELPLEFMKLLNSETMTSPSIMVNQFSRLLETLITSLHQNCWR